MPASCPAALVALVLAVTFTIPYVKSCKSYKCERVKAVYWPELAEKRFRYQNEQSEIAVGSGGLFGKGLRGSTQGTLGFVPEVHNDFIYAVASEEWGFLGSFASLTLYLLLISRDGLDKARGLLQRLDRSATVYAEETLELPVTAAKVVRLPFAATAKKIDRLSIGTLALAAMLHDGGLLPLQALEESISAVLKPALAEVNRRALAAGAALAGEAREA